jgi:hypothetical protein
MHVFQVQYIVLSLAHTECVKDTIPVLVMCGVQKHGKVLDMLNDV